MKRARSWFSAVVCLLAAALTLNAAWTTKRLTSNTGDSDEPDIAVREANIYTVWYDGSAGNYDIYFRRSTDGGATWNTAKRLTNTTGFSGVPSIAVAGANVYAVWFDETPGNREIYFRKSTDGGATWQTAKKLTNSSGDSTSPDIAVRGANIYVTWYDNTPGNPEIFFRKSVDGGATWEATKNLSRNDGYSLYPSIAVSDTGVYVVWQDDTTGDEEIYLRKSTNGGASFQDTMVLTNNAGDSRSPNIAVIGSDVYLVWHDFSPGAWMVYFQKSTDGGATWQQVRNLDKTGGDGYARIAVSGSNVCVTWEDYTPGNGEIFFRKSTDGGATWLDPQRLTNDVNYSSFPKIAVNDANVFVIWKDKKPGNFDVYLKYSPL